MPAETSTANRQRNLFIAEARRTGSHTLQELADQYGLTRERVRQIAKAMGVESKGAAQLAHEQRRVEREAKVEGVAQAVLMRFIAGATIPKLAIEFGISRTEVRELLDERVTDQILAARSNFRAAAHYPGIPAGPIDESKPREDRFWTEQRVFERLLRLARECGGRLPSSTAYQQMSTNNPDLPSFRTVRLRLGRWAVVRVRVHAAL